MNSCVAKCAASILAAITASLGHPAFMNRDRASPDWRAAQPSAAPSIRALCGALWPSIGAALCRLYRPSTDALQTHCHSPLLLPATPALGGAHAPAHASTASRACV